MTDLLLMSTPLASRALPGGVCPSLSNVTVRSYARSCGVDVSILDPSVDLPAGGLDDPDALLDVVVDTVAEQRARVVGVSALSSVEGRFAVAFARRFKQKHPKTPVVVGGIWASASAEALLERAPEVDAVVTGPGELAAVALATCGLDAPESIPGLLWRSGDELRQNDAGAMPHTAPVLDLDALLRHPERYDIFCWMTSRGCPFTCSFCTERLTSPDHVRNHVVRVAGDVLAIERLGHPWYLWICDPLFGADRRHVESVCGQLEYSGLEFLIESRVDVLRPSDVPALSRAGCNLVYLGLESGSQDSLHTLGKIGQGEGRYRRYLEGAEAVVTACLQNDVLPVLGVLDPVPGATPKALEETLALLERLAALPEQLGAMANDLAPCFHAFPLRIDPGSEYAGRLEALRAQGVEFNEPEDPLFGDRYIARASPTVDEEMADAFREKVRALNVEAPHVQQRLWRSFPRPYVEFSV